MGSRLHARVSSRWGRAFLRRAWTAIPGRLQWPLLWLAHAKFSIGVTGVIFDEQGRVLLFRHVARDRYPWGLPAGWMRRHEQPRDTLVREVREEAGLDIEPGDVLAVYGGYALRVEVVVSAKIDSDRLISARPSLELYEAQAFDLAELPPVLPSHRAHIDLALREGASIAERLR